MDKKDIEQFFHEIAPRVLEFVKQHQNNNSITVQKDDTEHSVNYATETDVAVEQLITKAIKETFPGDAILAEEESDQTSLEQPGKLWIIDPICGTSNFARGLPLYVTNIALAENGKLVAALVVDHFSQKYFWSAGDGLFEDTKQYSVKKFQGTKIDIDTGSLINAPQEARDRHAAFISRMVRNTDICCVTLNTSLSFLLTALGVYNAFVTPWVHAWDICAPVFLVQQAGGIVTDIDGKPWTITSTNAVAAHDPKLHAMLLEYVKK